MADEMLFLSGINLDGNTIINAADPTNAQDLATKAYVDAVAQGLLVKDAVKAATTPVGGNITLSGEQTVDGVALVAGDRILVKNQTNPVENGIYIVATGAWSRSADFNGDPQGEVRPGCFTFVTGGTQENTGWVVTGSGSIVVDTDPINWTQFNGAGNIEAGDGLSKVGNTLNVNVDNSTVEISSDNIQVKDLGITTAKLANDSVTKDKINPDVAGNGIGQNVDGSLEVNVDNSTLEVDTDALRIKDLGVTTAKLADDSVTKDKVNADVAGSGLGQNVDGSLEVNVDNTTIEITTDSLNLKDGAVTYTKLNSATLDTNLIDGATADTVPTSQAVVDLVNYEKYATTITGTGAIKTFTITHNKNTRDIASVSVWEASSPYQKVEVSTYADTLNDIRLVFGKNVPNGVQYRVIVKI